MIPKILDYEDGRIIITAEAFAIPELNAIIKKHDRNAEPYLMYAHLMTHPESPHINLSAEDKKENIIYDVIQTCGDFDIDDELLEPAVKRLEGFFITRTQRYYNNLCKIMDKSEVYADTLEFNDENAGQLTKMLKEGSATMKSFKEAEKQIDEELKTKMRGKNVLGDY